MDYQETEFIVSFSLNRENNNGWGNISISHPTTDANSKEEAIDTVEKIYKGRIKEIHSVVTRETDPT